MPALVPSAKNDKLFMPNSEVYIFNVPFSIDQKNIIDFSSVSDQTNKMIAYATRTGHPHLHYNNCNIIRKDRSLFIEHGFASPSANDMYNFNYMMFRNDDLENEDNETSNVKWWYAFITNTEYQGKGTSRVDFVIDVWQTFQFDITYRKCMVERSHIPLSQDSFRLWNEPEPLRVLPYGESDNLNTKGSNLWLIKALVIAQSVPDGGIVEDFWHNLNQPHFAYGNTGRTETSFSENSTVLYGLDLEEFHGGSSSTWGGNYSALLDTYNKAFGDHRNDLLYLELIPNFMYQNLNVGIEGGLESGFYGVKSNSPITREVLQYNMSETHLAPTVTGYNYKPRNKKLLSSLCRTFVIYNESGFTAYIRPEDVTISNNSEISIKASGNPLPLSVIKLQTDDLRLKSGSFWYIPYDYKISIAYNENEGATQKIKQLNAGINFALSVGSAVATAGSSIAMGNIANAGIASAFNTSLESGLGSNNINLGRAVDTKTLTSANSANAMLSSSNDVFGSGLSLYQASVETHTAGNSNMNDILQYRNTCMHLHINEIYATKEQLRECDDFLDMYGYARNEILLLSSVMRNRSNWNYIKTINCNLSALCNTDYEIALRTIFNNGVTIWHGFDKLESGYNINDNDNKNT